VQGQAPWHPFKDADEWELARWMMKSKTSEQDKDEYLKLKSVSTSSIYSGTELTYSFKVHEKLDLVFKNKQSYYRFINSLPRGPKWSCTIMKVARDLRDEEGKPIIETLELWHHDPVEIIEDLLGNPSFLEHQAYSPHQIYLSQNRKKCQYSEMWTVNWWWNKQVCQPKLTSKQHCSLPISRNSSLLVPRLLLSSSPPIKPSF
jgi:hypothetical protein